MTLQHHMHIRARGCSRTHMHWCTMCTARNTQAAPSFPSLPLLKKGTHYLLECGLGGHIIPQNFREEGLVRRNQVIPLRRTGFHHTGVLLSLCSSLLPQHTSESNNAIKPNFS